MNRSVALPANSSLRALCGAVGEVADAVGGWDRLVSLWRIFRALDQLMAVLWSIVHRSAADGVPVGGFCPGGAMAVLSEPPGVGGTGAVRRASRMPTARLRAVRPVAAVAGVRAMAGWSGLAGRVDRPGGARVMGGISPVLAVRCRRFSEPRWDTSQNDVLIVPV